MQPCSCAAHTADSGVASALNDVHRNRSPRTKMLSERNKIGHGQLSQQTFLWEEFGMSVVKTPKLSSVHMTNRDDNASADSVVDEAAIDDDD